jgi:hypothetical protein
MSTALSTKYVRWSGLALIAVGLLLTPGVAHPDVFEVGFAAPAVEPLWVVMHVCWLVATVLSIFGVAGLVVAQGARLARLGWLGVALTVPGLVAVACLMWYEAVVMPGLAREDPRLLALDGPLLTSPEYIVGGSFAALWLLGLLLIAVGTWRAGVLPRGAAVTLGVGAVGMAAFETAFVPVLGVVSLLVFAAGHVLLGTALLAKPGAASPRLAR